jgi:hypothetical protein
MQALTDNNISPVSLEAAPQGKVEVRTDEWCSPRDQAYYESSFLKLDGI